MPKKKKTLKQQGKILQRFLAHKHHQNAPKAKQFASECCSLESIMRVMFGFSAIVCILAVGNVWQPLNEVFGIFPMIVGSVYVTGLAIAFGVPFGILCAVYLAYFSRQNKILTPLVELMAGIPSIVYGFFGLIVVVPFFSQIFETNGKGLMSASVLLAMMILPTIILVSKSSIEAVSKSYFEGAIALGASKERAVFFVVLRDAKSGILASVILGIGRAIGEAMAVIVIAGNQPVIPQSISDGVRTMTTNIVLELGYASGIHRDALIASSAVLFVFILLINACFLAIKKRA